MASKGIEVGAWKLEDPEKRIRFEASPALHTEVLGLVSLLPEHGVRSHSVYDLRYSNEQGSSTLFTVRPMKAHAFDEVGFMNGIDIRLSQAVKVGRNLQRLVTIFDGSLALHQPQEIAGGRKLHDWPIFPVAHPDHKPFPVNAPYYPNQKALLEDIEALAPVDAEGITGRLKGLRSYLVGLTVEPAAFERSAQAFALTF